MLSHTSFIWWMRLESNQQCREAGDLQSPGVTSFPTHPYFGSPSTDRTYDIFVNSEAQLPLCYRGIDWLQRQDSHLRSPAYETGEDDWTPLLCDNWCPGRDSNSIRASLVRLVRLELTRPFDHGLLRTAWLPLHHRRINLLSPTFMVSGNFSFMFFAFRFS